jgi:hypothetical protein
MHCQKRARTKTNTPGQVRLVRTSQGTHARPRLRLDKQVRLGSTEVPARLALVSPHPRPRANLIASPGRRLLSQVFYYGLR